MRREGAEPWGQGSRALAAQPQHICEEGVRPQWGTPERWVGLLGCGSAEPPALWASTHAHASFTGAGTPTVRTLQRPPPQGTVKPSCLVTVWSFSRQNKSLC